MKCSDFEMLRVPNPEAELTIQVALKTAQIGTLIGSLIVAPMNHILNDSAFGKKDALQYSITKFGICGGLTGLLVGPIISSLWQQNWNDIEKFDRCYRLRFNRRKLNADRCAVLGATLGGIIDGGHGLVLGVDLSLLANLLFAGYSPFSFNVDD
uniref:Uncharacterized protein n=1 Tax=Romanomermis culicivorax TaxID=13658 RepID=A0A915J5W0_ROMCU